MSTMDQLKPENIERKVSFYHVYLKRSGILQKEIDELNDIAKQLTNEPEKVVQIEEWDANGNKELQFEIIPDPEIKIVNQEKDQKNTETLNDPNENKEQLKEEIVIINETNQEKDIGVKKEPVENPEEKPKEIPNENKEQLKEEMNEKVEKEEETKNETIVQNPEENKEKKEIQKVEEEEIEGDYDRKLPLHSTVANPLLFLWLLTGEKRESLPTNELLRDKFTKREKIDINQLDDLGNTPLHLAVQKKQEQTVQILILTGCDMNIQNKDKDTPLLIAVRNNYTLITNILCNAGADINICDKDGHLPIQLAVKHLSETDLGETCQPLISKGADVSYLYQRAIVRKIDPTQYDEFGFLNEDKIKMKDYVLGMKNDKVKKEYEKYEK